MKIVINTCFGGFDLSPLAISRIAELQGRKCFFFDEDKPITIEELGPNSFYSAFDIPTISILSPEDFYKLSDEERKKWNEEYKKHRISDFRDDRINPILVQVVEELGSKANGSCAKLKVVEIPSDVEWEIDEYDGAETIREKHRSWS